MVLGCQKYLASNAKEAGCTSPPPPMPAEPSHPSSSLQDGGGIGSEGRFRLWQGGYLALPLACALLPQCGVPGKLAHP